jgi:hypothetical protein
MPAETTIKLRAGTKSQWSATSKRKTVTSASVVTVDGETFARYVSTSHGFAIGDKVTITGLTVASGNNPYNVSGRSIVAVATNSFDIKLEDGTTGAATNSLGTAVLVVLAKGESAVETDTFSLKIGDGTSAWEDIPYVNFTANKASYYVLNSNQDMAGSTNEQNIFDNRLPLEASTTYQFEIQATILTTNTTSKNFAFGFEQTGMTAWSTTRYNWVVGTRPDETIHYSLEDKTFAGSSPVTDSLINLYPADTNPVVFFNIKGIIRTGAGSSYFQPRIDWSTSPGTGTQVLSGSFIRVEKLGESSVTSIGGWTTNT